MNDKKGDQEASLTVLFDMAANQPPTPSPEFVARVVEDADRLIGSKTPERVFRWRRVLGRRPRILAGWPAVAVLSSVAAVGILIGFTSAGFVDPANWRQSGVTGLEPVDLMVSLDAILEEG